MVQNITSLNNFFLNSNYVIHFKQTSKGVTQSFDCDITPTIHHYINTSTFIQPYNLFHFLFSPVWSE